MTKQDKLDDIIFSAIKQRVGKNASKEEFFEYIKNLSTSDFFNIIDEGLTDDDRKAMLKADGDGRDDGDCKDLDDDFYDFWDDGFSGSGRLECMPAIEVNKYTLRIKLRGISPSIWRKIEVPSSVKLTSLAEIIITAMGWYNEHLHQFVSKGRAELYATAQKDDDDAFFGNRRRLWGGDYTIGHLLKNEKDKVVFEYDFGDGWEHDVVLSKAEKYAEGEPRVVRLISGKRACPPENCGGVWGYNDICDAMKHPYSKRAREMKNLLGCMFNPEDFWLEDAQDEINSFNE